MSDELKMVTLFALVGHGDDENKVQMDMSDSSLMMFTYEDDAVKAAVRHKKQVKKYELVSKKSHEEVLASQISNNTKETHLRVKELEEALQSTNQELANVIFVYNKKLTGEIQCTDLDEPDYLDMQTCHENSVLLNNK